MTIQSDNDGVSDINESEIPPNTLVITQQSSKPHFRPAFAH
jgi:hypothetical protein